MPGRDARRQRQVELAQPPPLAPRAQQHTNPRLRLIGRYRRPRRLARTSEVIDTTTPSRHADGVLELASAHHVDERPQYDERMQRSRVTVTVRPEVLAAAEDEVMAGRASSLSAWVDQAMEEKTRREELVGLLAEMRAENGPATEDEDAWARHVLGL